MSCKLAGALVLLTALSACKKDEPAPPPQPPPATGETVEQASEQAPEQAPAQGKAEQPDVSKALGALAKAAQTAQEQGKAQGKVVNWRQLAVFMPEKLGGFAATGEVKGSTTSMMGMQVSTVKQTYKQGEQRLRVEIVDTNLVPMMRAGLAMAQTINEDSSDGLKRGATVQGQPALLEWRKASRKGNLTLAAGDRYLTTLRLSPTDDPQAVLKLAEDLELKKLATLKAE